MPDRSRPFPRRFRRRLWLSLLGAGLAPALALAVAAHAALRQAISLEPPVEAVLARAADALDGGARPAAAEPRLAEELRQSALMMAQADLARQALLRRLPLLLAIGVGGLALALAGLAFTLGRRFWGRVEALAAGMERYGRGDLAHQIALPAGPARDELDHLIVAFNRMGAELAAGRERLRASEQVAAWRDVARAMAHDLKNPLTAMKMAVARLSRPGRSDAAIVESASLLQEEIDVLMRLTQSFSEFARLPAPALRAVELGTLAAEVAAVYRQERPDLRIDLAAGPGAPFEVEGDADQLRRALGNLVKNALEASRPGSSPVEIAVRADGRDAVVVSVADAGAGIGVAVEGAALLAGLATTKPDGQGLGLPLAARIVHEHGGTLRLRPRSGVGTEALLELPRRSLPATAPQREEG